jgi:hypothetical protein
VPAGNGAAGATAHGMLPWSGQVVEPDGGASLWPSPVEQPAPVPR